MARSKTLKLARRLHSSGPPWDSDARRCRHQAANPFCVLIQPKLAVGRVHRLAEAGSKI
jgi:hypothetical protein